MHYRLSNENQEEKILKSKHFFSSALKKNRWFPFEKARDYQYFATNIFSCEKCDFFWSFWPKNWKGWPDNFETFHKEKSGILEKKPRKRKFYPGSPSSYWVPKI